MHESKRSPTGWLLASWTFVLFLVWSNSFIAIGLLLGSEEQAARFGPLELTIARFLPVLLVALPICVLRWPRESWSTIRRHYGRLLVCGFLAVPGYQIALYTGQANGIPAPVASLETSLAPLFLMLLAAAFLGERLSRRKLVGFAIAVVGLGMIAAAKSDDSEVPYAGLVAITALAPLAWAVYSILTKPIAHEVHPVLWAYLVSIFGTLPLLPLAPTYGIPQLMALDGVGWFSLLYLSMLCTTLGYAIWGWLLRHLPASSVGFTIFLNPPLTTISKAALAVLLPALFAFRIVGLEWAGGAIVLTGLAVALTRGRPAILATVPPE